MKRFVVIIDSVSFVGDRVVRLSVCKYPDYKFVKMDVFDFDAFYDE